MGPDGKQRLLRKYHLPILLGLGVCLFVLIYVRTAFIVELSTYDLSLRRHKVVAVGLRPVFQLSDYKTIKTFAPFNVETAHGRTPENGEGYLLVSISAGPGRHAYGHGEKIRRMLYPDYHWNRWMRLAEEDPQQSNVGWGKFTKLLQCGDLENALRFLYAMLDDAPEPGTSINAEVVPAE